MWECSRLLHTCSIMHAITASAVSLTQAMHTTTWHDVTAVLMRETQPPLVRRLKTSTSRALLLTLMHPPVQACSPHWSCLCQLHAWLLPSPSPACGAPPHLRVVAPAVSTAICLPHPFFCDSSLTVYFHFHFHCIWFTDIDERDSKHKCGASQEIRSACPHA